MKRPKLSMKRLLRGRQEIKRAEEHVRQVERFIEETRAKAKEKK